MRTILLILTTLCVGCGPQYYPPDSYDPGPPETIWVSQVVGVGHQCSGIAVEHPDLAATGAEAGLTVHAYERQERPTCRACFQCPAKSAIHFLQIGAEEEAQAKALGFQLASPPNDAL